MGRERKRDLAPASPDAASTSAHLRLTRFTVDNTAAAIFGAGTPRARWFDLVDHHAQPAPTRREGYAAGTLIAAALLAEIVGRGVVLRVVLPLCLAAAVVALLVRGAKRARAARRPPATRRGLSFDGEQVV